MLKKPLKKSLPLKTKLPLGAKSRTLLKLDSAKNKCDINGQSGKALKEAKNNILLDKQRATAKLLDSLDCSISSSDIIEYNKGQTPKDKKHAYDSTDSEPDNPDAVAVPSKSLIIPSKPLTISKPKSRSNMYTIPSSDADSNFDSDQDSDQDSNQDQELELDSELDSDHDDMVVAKIRARRPSNKSVNKKGPGRPRKTPKKEPIPRKGISKGPTDEGGVVEMLYDKPTIMKKVFQYFKTVAASQVQIIFRPKNIIFYAVDH